MRWSTKLTCDIRSRRGSLTWAPFLALKNVVEGEASPLPSLLVRKGFIGNEFFGRLVEKMAEVGSGSSMTSNHDIEIVQLKHIHSEA